MLKTKRFSQKLFRHGAKTKIPNEEILVIREKEGFRAFRDVCPHLGGPLSKGEYCKKNQTIQCPWHGHIFSLKSLDLLENPNEKVWAEKFGEQSGKDFKIREFKCYPKNQDIIIEE